MGGWKDRWMGGWMDVDQVNLMLLIINDVIRKRLTNEEPILQMLSVDNSGLISISMCDYHEPRLASSDIWQSLLKWAGSLE